MASRTSSLSLNDLKRELRMRECIFVRAAGMREIWKTPTGRKLFVPTRGVSSAGLMMINQTLREDDIREIHHMSQTAPKERTSDAPTPPQPVQAPVKQIPLFVVPSKPERKAERLVDVLRRKLWDARDRARS